MPEKKNVEVRVTVNTVDENTHTAEDFENFNPKDCGLNFVVMDMAVMKEPELKRSQRKDDDVEHLLSQVFCVHKPSTMYQVPFSVKGNWYTSDNIPEMAKVIESLRKGDNIRVWGQVAHARVRKHSIHTIIAHKIKIFQR